jgi:asparagine synthetase B (glutamine-hydrolysing)
VLGLPLEEVEFDTRRLLDDFHRVLDLLEESPRNPNNLVLIQLYEAMARSGIDCALNGDGAEMLLGLADTRRVGRFARKHRMSDFLPGACAHP